MKIAVTGHTAGIGQALSRVLESRGHEIIGLSRRTGSNIKSLTKTVEKIKDCDVFINNAQSQYSQVELLFAVYELWQHDNNKMIWCIGTDLSRMPTAQSLPNHSLTEELAYRNQKCALDEAVRQLQYQSKIHILLIRPGGVATQPGQQAEYPYSDVDIWANTVVDLISQTYAKGLNLREFSLTCMPRTIQI